MNDNDIQGYFWQPEEPKNRIFGKIASEHTDIVLTLYDCFQPYKISAEIMANDNLDELRYRYLLGHLNNGEYVILINLINNSFSGNPFGRVYYITFNVEYALYAPHFFFEDLPKLRFKTCKFKFPHIDSIMDNSLMMPHTNDSSYIVDGNSNKYNLYTSNSLVIMCSNSSTCKWGDNKKTEIAPDTNILFEFRRQIEIESIVDIYLMGFVNLFTLILCKNIYPTEIFLSVNSIDKEKYFDIRFEIARYNFDKKKDDKIRITYTQDIKDNFQMLYSKFIELHNKHRHWFYTYLSSYNHDKVLEDCYLNTVFCLEALLKYTNPDNRYYRNDDFDRIIEELITRVKSEYSLILPTNLLKRIEKQLLGSNKKNSYRAILDFLYDNKIISENLFGKDLSKLAYTINTFRNRLVHLDSIEIVTQETGHNFAQIYFRTKCIFEMCLFVYLGLSVEVVIKILRHNYSLYVVEEKHRKTGLTKPTLLVN